MCLSYTVRQTHFLACSQELLQLQQRHPSLIEASATGSIKQVIFLHSFRATSSWSTDCSPRVDRLSIPHFPHSSRIDQLLHARSLLVLSRS